MIKSKYLITILCPAILFIFILRGTFVHAEEETGNAFLDQFAPVEFHGFMELRGGVRTQDDSHGEEISVMEARFQAELYTYADWIEFKYKGDLWGDAVMEQDEYETREAWFFLRPSDVLDVKIGRQVLTWGTGDLVFLNDLFPKDWQSYFIGRDAEYLKAPSDAAKISFFNDYINMDVVYTPQFDPDRYITGEYISYWNNGLGRLAGEDDTVAPDLPDRWFRDDEVAVRIYKNVANYELALYGYSGFWKQPSGENAAGKPIFPKLNAYGFSARGRIFGGIGNIEAAYYDSVDDIGGDDPMIDNSQIRYLAGYSRDLAMDLNMGLQYYVEQLLEYDAYLDNLKSGTVRDEYRHVITLQLTQLLMNQNLEIAFSGYFSPSDQDAYLRPKISYAYSDHIDLETGADIFIGAEQDTFFGQFEKNTNVYTAVRYSF